MKRYNCLFALTAIVIAGAFLGKAEAQPMPSGTLPVFYVDIYRGQQLTINSNYSYGSYRLDANGYEGVATAKGDVYVDGIKGFSWDHYEKKPFSVDLDFEADLIGTGDGEGYCLFPHCDDYRAFLCHTVGYELSRRIGLAWTPRQVPVELVLNGDYRGVYFMTEKIDARPNRVNVEKQYRDDYDVKNAYFGTGGFLLFFDAYCEGDGIAINPRWVQNSIGQLYKTAELFIANYECPGIKRNNNGGSYIFPRLEKTHESIKEIPNSDRWEDYIDMDTLACYYIVNELMDNIEAFHNNCWMHKRRGEDTKLLFGPVWDFSNALTREPGKQDFIYNQAEPRMFSSHWIDKISQSPRFQECVRKHYAEFKEKNGTDLDAFIDDFIDEIEAGVQADLKRWPSLGKPNLRAEAQQFKRVFRAKEAFLDRHWLGVSAIDDVAIENDEEYITVTSISGDVIYRGKREGFNPPLRQVLIVRSDNKVEKICRMR